MCTSFVYRKENVLIGMNFDNNGMKFRVSAKPGKGFLVSAEVRGNFYPSFGVSANGIFVNNLMVDSNGEAPYKRQNEKRWINSALVEQVMDGDTTLETLRSKIARVEIVNGPFMSTHNMITAGDGATLVVEPGKRTIYSTAGDSGWYVMTNFPLSDYGDLIPENPSGSGADRYKKAANYLDSLTGPMSVDQGFDLLREVRQHGPEWKTVLSLIFDPSRGEVFYVLTEKPDPILSVSLN